MTQFSSQWILSLDQLSHFWGKSMIPKVSFSLGYSPTTLTRSLSGLNFSELEDFVANVARTYVLSLPEGESKKIVSAKLKQMKFRAGLSTSRRRTKAT